MVSTFRRFVVAIAVAMVRSSQAKIDNVHKIAIFACAKQNVLGLQITMKHFARMHSFQSGEKLIQDHEPRLK